MSRRRKHGRRGGDPGHFAGAHASSACGGIAAAPSSASPAYVGDGALKAMPSAAFLLLLTFAAYLPALKADFIWDDDAYVTGNPVLRDPAGLRRIWLEPTATIQYYPLVFTTFWLEYRLWGLAPFGYHFVNVLLHAINVILLWRVLRSLEIPGALAAAVIFAVHPVHVESVAWVTERKNVLSLAFYLAAALAYLSFAGIGGPATVLSQRGAGAIGTADIPGRRGWRYALALLFFVMALLSKSATLGLPVALAIVIWWKRPESLMSHAAPLLAFIPFIVLSAIMTTYVERHHVGAAEMDWSLTWVQRFLLAGRSIWFYLGKLAWPANLAFIYHRDDISVDAWQSYLCLPAVLALIATLWLSRRRFGMGPLVAVLFFIVTVAPALGFIPFFFMTYSFVADHFVYIASIGPIVLGACVWTRVASRSPARRAAATVVIAVLLATLASLTFKRCGVFKNQETLWKDVLAKSPSAARQAHDNLAVYYASQARLEEAALHYRESLRFKAEQPEVLSNLGGVLYRLGRRQEALSVLREAIRIQPSHADAHCNLALILSGGGASDEAISHYRKAIAARPGFATAHFNLARLLAAQGRLLEAEAEYREVLRLDPADTEARAELQTLLRRIETPP